jgi:hypothetical protein
MDSLGVYGTKNSRMKLKFFIGCLLVAVVAFGTTLGMAYSSGRWDVAIGPEIAFSKVMGLAVWIFGCFILWLKFGKQGNFKTYMVLGLSIALSLIFFSKTSSRLMVKVYAIGFERAVFSAASPEQWSSVPMIMKKNRERLTKQEILNNDGYIWKLPPDFVWRVFPSFPPWGLNEDKLIIFYERGWSFNRVLEIGDLKSDGLSSQNVIYQKVYSNNISILLIGGDD